MNRVILVALILVGLALPAAAQTTVTMLDVGGGSPAIAVGPDGLGLIAYSGNGGLKIAHCSNAACTSATLSTIDSGNTGLSPSLAIGADGLGVVSYHDAGGSALKIAHCNDPSCTSAVVTVVDTAASLGQSNIAIGVDGLPLVAYGASNPAGVRTAHCAVPDCTQVTVAFAGAWPAGKVSMVIPPAVGRGLVGLEVPPSGNVAILALRRCVDVACTAFQGSADEPTAIGQVLNPVGALLGDGFPFFAYNVIWTDPTGPSLWTEVIICTGAPCFFTQFHIGVGHVLPALAAQPNGRGWIAWPDAQGNIRLLTCLNDTCTARTETCAFTSQASELSLARGGDGRPLAAFHGSGGLQVIHGLDASCVLPILNVADATAREGGSVSFPVSLGTFSNWPVTVGYATQDGTAAAGMDYVATSGVLTFPPGATTVQVEVPTLSDGTAEPDETFSLVLSAPVGAAFGDNQGSGTVLDGDGPPEISARECVQAEGDSGTQGCAVPVTLSVPSTQTVTVDYATNGGTATAGVDYLSAAGTLTFTPGTTSMAVSVSVVGDTDVELDENFFFDLSNPVNATLGSLGGGFIVDDDAPPLSNLELTHGARVMADLAAAPGPVAQPDLYRLAQAPFTSWEVVVDEVSGDVAPGLLLELLAEDNATVIHTGFPVGTGSARSLRWQYPGPLNEVRHHIRVSSTSCTSDCDADDRYRLRAYETTGLISRFNNAGSQVTVLVLQNASAEHVTAIASFWRADGTLADFLTFPLGPHTNAALNTSTVPTLTGLSGSITVSHNGPYGALAGKAVALEPSTGFSFDSPMTPKPR